MRVERELRARLEVLEAENRKLAAILRDAPVPVGIYRGRDHVIVEVNEVNRRIFFGGRQVAGVPLREANLSAEKAGIIALFDRVFATGETYVHDEFPVAIRRPDGQKAETFWKLTFQPTRDASGVVDGVAAIGVEITEQVMARRRIEAARAESDRQSRTKDEFLALLGHELRNPLAPILTALEVLRLRGTRARELEVIERQARHLSRLVDDMLDLSRIHRARVRLVCSTVDLADAIGQAVEMARPLLDRRGHKLEVAVPRGLLVEGDPCRLAQVFSNLLTNAARYTPTAGRIRVRAAARNGDVVTHVIDDGKGIPKEMQDRIFDPFVQGDRAREHAEGGLGLGLALVRSLVELHGGTVAVRSEGEGHGSDFEVRLPSAPAGAVARRAPKVRAERSTPVPLRVLLVDDNVDAVELLGVVLESAGHTVAVAYDSRSAEEVAARFAPDVAVLDIGLPDMDGHELARRLRERPGGERLRLIAVTGYGRDDDRERSRAAAFEHHFVKPVDVNLLLQALAPPSGSCPAPHAVDSDI